MKPNLVFSSIVGMSILLTAKIASAQTWHTVDSYQYMGLGSGNFGLTVAPSGVVFASGGGYDGTNGDHGLIVASADAGNTWSAPVDDFSVLNASVEESGGITADTSGNLYVAGYYYFDTPGQEHQFVRRSADGGASWQIVDDVAQAIGADDSPKPGAITTDSAGNVYVAERMWSSGHEYWVICKGTGGTNYATVDLFTTGSSAAQAVYAHPTAGVFAVGNANNWTVRRSLNAGATWATVDAYQYSSGTPSYADNIGADAHGNLYVVGHAQVTTKKVTVWHWIVRKSSNGGNSWSTVDDYAAGGEAAAFAADSNGNLYVAGYTSSGWTVRESIGGSGIWQPVDTVSGGGALSVAADRQGNVFVGGGLSSGWTVRRNR